MRTIQRLVQHQRLLRFAELHHAPHAVEIALEMPVKAGPQSETYGILPCVQMDKKTPMKSLERYPTGEFSLIDWLNLSIVRENVKGLCQKFAVFVAIRKKCGDMGGQTEAPELSIDRTEAPRATRAHRTGRIAIAKGRKRSGGKRGRSP